MKRILIFTIVMIALAGSVVAQEDTSLIRNFGSLTARDDQYQGGAIDWYTVTAPEDGRFIITVVTPDFYPVIVIERPREYPQEMVGQRTLASGGISVTRGQTVEVGVTGRIGGAYGPPLMGNVPADYIVVVKMGPAGQNLVVGEMIDGELQTGDESSPDGAFIDYYEVDVYPDQHLQVNLVSDDFDTYLEVELPDGELLENDDAMDTNSSITFSPAVAGVARIGATSFGYVDYGRYTIEIVEVTIDSLRVGDIREGDLSSANQIYELTGTPGQAVQIELTSDYFDTYLEIEDNYGYYDYNDDAESTSVSRLVYVFNDDGQVMVTVSSFGGEGGPFQISATEMAFGESDYEDGYRVRSGDYLSGSLIPSPDTLDGKYFQRFTFTAQAGERFEIIMRSDILDSYLQVVSPYGSEYRDDDSGGGWDSRLLLVAEDDGIYDLYVTTSGSGGTGDYTLEFTLMGESQTILNTTGELTSRDPLDVMGRRYDEYAFTAITDGTVIIDVKSDEFDGYAVLKDSEGNLLVNDDDSGGNGDPRIEWDLYAGETYVLVVTTYSSGSDGAYSVSIYQ